MALAAYLSATNRLLTNPVPNPPLYTTADLTAYINEGRQQLAGEAECIRASSSGVLTAAQQEYAFSLFTLYTGGNVTLTGISGTLSIREMRVASGTGFARMYNRPWDWFYRYYLSSGAAQVTGVPNTWAQLGRGTKGTFAISPVPTSGLTIRVDVTCLPIPLVDDTTPEAIPAPFTDAIPYFAAYKAYLSSQRRDDATVMFGRYQQFVARGTQQSTPTQLPMQQPGGPGAQLAGAATPISALAPAQRGQ